MEVWQMAAYLYSNAGGGGGWGWGIQKMLFLGPWGAGAGSFYYTIQWPVIYNNNISRGDSRWTTGTRRIRAGGAGIIPVKDSHTRIKPLALASGHGRYIT
jgi:hypothetical protein